MQDLDSNINDLFRKASEHYSLKAAKSDWDNIAAELHQDTVPASPRSEKNGRKKILFFCLFFFQ